MDSTADTGDATLRVVLLYENRAAGQRAMRLLDWLDERIGEQMELQPQLWRFDLLKDPEWRALAQADAANAQLIVVATCSDADLPGAVKSWLTDWAARSIPGEAALVALLSSHRPRAGGESSAYRFLQTTAREAGQAFFAQELRGPSLSTEINLEAIRRRAEATSSVLLGILERDRPLSRWGLNE